MSTHEHDVTVPVPGEVLGMDEAGEPAPAPLAALAGLASLMDEAGEDAAVLDPGPEPVVGLGEALAPDEPDEVDRDPGRRGAGFALPSPAAPVMAPVSPVVAGGVVGPVVGHAKPKPLGLGALAAAALAAPVVLSAERVALWRRERAAGAVEGLEHRVQEFAWRVDALEETPVGERLRARAGALGREDRAGADQVERELEQWLSRNPDVRSMVHGLDRSARQIVRAARDAAARAERASRPSEVERTRSALERMAAEVSRLDGLRWGGENIAHRVSAWAREAIEAMTRLLERLGFHGRRVSGPERGPSPSPGLA